MTVSEWTHAHTRTALAALIGVGLLVLLFVHEAQSKGQDVADLKTFIAQKEAERNKSDADAKAALAAANAKIEYLEKQRQAVYVNPSTAPQIIREYLPTSQPIAQTAPITKDTLPDAPVAVLTAKQEQELAGFALTCKECAIKSDAMQTALTTKDADIKTLTTERDAAVKTAKGGSIWDRVGVILKYSACGGAGAAIGSREGNAKGAAIGAASAVIGCSFIKLHRKKRGAT